MEIEIGDVEGAELGTSSGEDTVEHEFDEFKRGGFGAYVAWVADAVARYCDSGAVGIVLFGPDLANYIAVADFFEPVGWYVGEVDDVEGIGAGDGFVGWSGAWEALTKAPEFFGVGGAPDVFVLGVLDELPVFQRFSGFVVQD